MNRGMLKLVTLDSTSCPGEVGKNLLNQAQLSKVQCRDEPLSYADGDRNSYA
jgi:hypothetical protein